MELLRRIVGIQGLGVHWQPGKDPTNGARIDGNEEPARWFGGELPRVVASLWWRLFAGSTGIDVWPGGCGGVKWGLWGVCEAVSTLAEWGGVGCVVMEGGTVMHCSREEGAGGRFAVVTGLMYGGRVGYYG